MEEFIAKKLSYENLVALVRALAEGNITVDQLVSSVNGKTGAVKLSATDVGARPYNWTPSAEEVGARPDTWMPSLEEVGAEKSGAAASQVSAHNTNTGAHNDIRLELQTLANRINAALDSDDTTLDALSEIVVYIKNNKTLIDGITASKVNVADIIDNLTTNMADKPLSAAQGVALKALIDGKLDASALTTAINNALAQAKDSGEFDGEDGVGISSIANTGTNGNVDTYTITLSNGDTVTFTITNGTNGENGTNGKTPVYGVDYFTPEDIANIVKSVHESIGTPIFGIINAEKEILLSGKDVPIDNYTVAYINEDGSKTPIGTLELDTNVYYSVTKTLTYCTISNSATKVVKGEPYNATITANSGYELKSVTVTMGGANVSVTNGVINIASVTGNIVINAVAEVAGPAYINQIPISTDTDNSVFNGTGYHEKRRLSSSYAVSTLTNESASNPAFVTGFIPAKAGDIIRLENCYVDSNYVKDTAIYGADTASFNIGIFNSSKTKVGSQANQWPRMSAAGCDAYSTSAYFDSFVTDSNGYTTQFRVKTGLGIDISYVRLCLAVKAGFTVADAIATVNQNIV